VDSAGGKCPAGGWLIETKIWEGRRGLEGWFRRKRRRFSAKKREKNDFLFQKFARFSLGMIADSLREIGRSSWIS